MAKSKFLRYQDKNNDKVSDECPVLDIIPEPNVCLDCIPNPKAIVPKWTKKTIDDPFLNEKVCKFQITVVTSHTTTIEPEALQKINSQPEVEAASDFQPVGPTTLEMAATKNRYDEHVAEAIEAFLTAYNKEPSATNKEALKNAIEYTAYSLDPHPGSTLKLLYSVPFSDLLALEDDSGAEEEEEEPEGGDTVVEFEAVDLVTRMIRVRKGLNLYSRYLKVYRALEGGNMLFEKTGALFNLENYGDLGIFPTSTMAELIDQLDVFLNQKGHNLPGTGNISFFKNKVVRIEFKFNKDFKLKRLKIWTDGCPSTPTKFQGRRLKTLKNRPAWRDATACAYLARLDAMERDLTARVPKPWIEFVEEHTFPKIYTTQDPTVDSDQHPLSCMVDALAGEAKELGQDILDEVFSIGDAVAYFFHKSICRYSIDEWEDDLSAFGFSAGIASNEKTKTAIMAKEQAYKRIEDGDDIFKRMCAGMLGAAPIGCGMGGGGPQGALDALWYEGFDEIKICGLFDLMLDAIQCLMGGLTLEEALASMIKAALQSMGIENFGVLFVGLPPEKQAELDALVRKKLESGDIFGPGSQGQQLSDAIEQGTGKPSEHRGQVMKWSQPWKNKKIVKEERKKRREGGGDSETPVGTPNQDVGQEVKSQRTDRTLAQQFDIAGGAENELSPGVVMDAYIKALIDVYSENLLELMDELNKFPGAQLIATILATMDCPRPPIFSPGVFDWLKDLELPFCRNPNDLVFPRFENPFAAISNLKDVMAFLWWIAKQAIECAIYRIVMLILVKICEIIGDAICKALETVGDIAASLPDMLTGRDNFANVIGESICGPGASQEQIQDTMADMINTFGSGGAAFVDREKVLSFAEDVSAAVTRKELYSAFLGEASAGFTRVVDQTVEHAHPELSDALSNDNAITSMFTGVGNVMSADFRDQMRNFVDSLPEDDEMPANPSLCATPEQLDNFKDLRCSLLEGRATKEQCEAMFDDFRGNNPEAPGILSDLEDVAAIMQDGPGAFMQSMMPPLISDPGCDNGLLPFEPEEITKMTQQGLRGSWERLKIAYSTDMLGNGNFRNSNDSWGLINMVMSDTMGNPLSTHHRKVYQRDNYVDHYIDTDDLPPAPDAKPLKVQGIVVFGNPWERGAPSNAGPLQDQKGAYPLYVAGWLYYQMAETKAQMAPGTPRGAEGTAIGSVTGLVGQWNSNNTFEDDWIVKKSFKALDFDGPFGGPDPDPLAMPDLGYNVGVTIKMDKEAKGGGRVKFTRRGRKHIPDLELVFIDNASGLRGINKGDSVDAKWNVFPVNAENHVIKKKSPFAKGSNIRLFLSDLIDDGSGPRNLPTDNMRVEVYEWLNQNATEVEAVVNTLEEREEDEDRDDENEPDSKVLKNRKYEFMGVDDTLSKFDLTAFPEFQKSFHSQREEMPQVYLLQELLDNKVTLSEAKSLQDDVMNSIYDKFLETIMTPEIAAAPSTSFIGGAAKGPPAFLYGAALDNIQPYDFDYLVPDGAGYSEYAGKLYADFEVKRTKKNGDEVDKPVRNDDMILGVSRDQYNNGDEARVVYLDPKKYGGSYIKPKVTVKPLESKGWMGFIDALFPQISPCKPQRSDMVDFGDVEATINQDMMTIAHDERLKQDKDCVIEKPFNRILERSGKAGVHGVIQAACRIFATTDMILGMATFSKFAPRFPEVYSNIYCAYVVERMEIAFRDAQRGGFEWLNPFKDNEFWYAFLEQAVQTYGRLVDDGKIEDPPQHILDILTDLSPLKIDSLNDTQERHKYPWRQDLFEAKKAGEENIFKTLSEYRKEENLATVAAAEENCKLVLQEFVKKELEWAGGKFQQNLKSIGMTPDVYDLDYYLLENLTEGGIPPSDVAGRPYRGPDGSGRSDVAGLDLDWDIKEVIMEGEKLPGNVYYTKGNELVNADDNEEYIGYYHVIKDDVDDTIFMEGEHHSDEEHAMLKPVANTIIVPIGDVAPMTKSWTGTAETPFCIDKYISINGTKHSPGSAMEIIRANPDQTKNISEVYPGTLKHVTDPGGRVVGLEGELGVRYGLRFRIGKGSSIQETVTTVEIDALDYPLSQIQPLEGNSVLLYCLIKKLKEDVKFQLCTRYIFPMSKILSSLAIYNTENFLDSVGQITVDDNASWSFWSYNALNPFGGFNVDQDKPGARADVNVEEFEIDGNPAYAIDFTQEGNPGWVSYRDRNPTWPAGIWVKEWDSWDKIILRKSSAALKGIFRAYYHNRDFAPPSEKGASASAIWLQGLRDSLKPAPGQSLAPKYLDFVSNAWNAEGGLCSKFDAD